MESGIIKEIEEIGIKGIPNIPPKAINIDQLGIDKEHINNRGHNVDLDTAKSYIKNARVSITKWNGKFEKYFSKQGAAYVNMDNNTIRTAYGKHEFDKR